jgi:hypothetical protein
MLLFIHKKNAAFFVTQNNTIGMTNATAHGIFALNITQCKEFATMCSMKTVQIIRAEGSGRNAYQKYGLQLQLLLPSLLHHMLVLFLHHQPR